MTSTALSVARVFTANATNNAAALAVTLAAARFMSTADFGTLGLALAVIVVTATLADWGSGPALVRAFGRDPRAAPRAGACVMAWKLLLVPVFAGVALLVPLDWVAAAWPGLANRALLVVTMLAAGLLGCWTSRRALEQARENFRELQRVTLACAALRVAAFAACVAAGVVDPMTVLLCLYVAPLVGVMWWRRVAVGSGVGRENNAVPGREPILAAGRELVRYAGWVGASALCFVAFTRAPLLVLGHAGDAHQTGLLSGALTLTLGLAMLSDALRIVTLPRIVRAADASGRARARAWLLRGAWPAFALAAAALAILVAAYEPLLGPGHAEGARLLLIMGAATLATAALGLHNALVHALSLPRIEAAVNAGRLLAFAAVAGLLANSALALAGAYAVILVGGELALYVRVRAADRSRPKNTPGPIFPPPEKKGPGVFIEPGRKNTPGPIYS